MFSGLTLKEFKNRFKTKEDCMSYLVEQKWKDGYCCIKCRHSEYMKGRQWFYKRCRSCGYDESATANTLFHRCKVSLLTVFEMAFRISVRKKGMSTCELSKEFGCQQKTAWLLKAKLQQAMKSSEQYDLVGDIEVDEFMVGGFEPGSPGRSHGNKSLVVLAVERVVDKDGKQTIGRAYAKTIDDASSDSLKIIFDKHIATESNVRTDTWKGYVPLKKEWNINQELSKKGESFKQLHTHIMNIKGWLRGIHHKCSAERLQDYLNEFHFRFNRRGFLNSIWDKLMQRAVASKPCPYALLTVCELST